MPQSSLLQCRKCMNKGQNMQRGGYLERCKCMGPTISH